MLCHRHFPAQAESAGSESGMSETQSARDERTGDTTKASRGVKV